MGLCFLAFDKSLGFFTSATVFFPFCFCGLRSCRLSFLCGTLNGDSRDSVVPRLLTPHSHLEWPEAGSAALQDEVQQVGAAGRHMEVYVEVFVEVYANAIWTLCCLPEPPGSSSGSVAGSWITMG